MILHRLGLINKNQRGFTLVEIMLAIAISSVITGAAIMSIFQVFNVNTRASNHMTAVRQVQEAGYWVSRDTLMAQSVVLADESVDDPDGTRFPLTLTWSKWDTGEVHQVVYTLEDMPGSGLKNLQRSHSVNGTTETSIISQFIDPTEEDGEPQTKCEFTGGKLTFKVTATVGNGSQEQGETRVYQVIPRPSS